MAVAFVSIYFKKEERPFKSGKYFVLCNILPNKGNFVNQLSLLPLK